MIRKILYLFMWTSLKRDRVMYLKATLNYVIKIQNFVEKSAI